VVIVRRGQTLTSIAQADLGSAGDWSALWDLNRATIPDPDLIYTGEPLVISGTAPSESTVADVTSDLTSAERHRLHLLHVLHLRHLTPAPATHSSSEPVETAAVSTSGDSSFQACVIRAESGGNSQIWNASGHYGLYQFSEETWVAYGGSPAEFGHATVAEQDRVFENAMATPGGADNWAPYDGCAP
jgi:hypothetical protein